MVTPETVRDKPGKPGNAHNGSDVCLLLVERSTENGGRSPCGGPKQGEISQVGRRSILHTGILHEGALHDTLPSRNPDYCQELADQTFVGMRNAFQMAVRYVRFAPDTVVDAAVCIGRDIGIAFSIACSGDSCGDVSTGGFNHRLMPMQGASTSAGSKTAASRMADIFLRSSITGSKYMYSSDITNPHPRQYQQIMTSPTTSLLPNPHTPVTLNPRSRVTLLSSVVRARRASVNHLER